MDAGLRLGVAKVAKYTLVFIALLFALTSAGLDLTSLAVMGGALGVGIGFGLQKVTSNLISGFLLLFDRSIRPGDVITIEDRFGWVEKMGARYIVVRDRNGVDTLIPNEELITSHVINWSYGDRQVRLKVPVQISYDDDPEAAMQLMEQAAKASERVITNPPPACRLLGFGDNGINLELRVWIEDPEKGVNNVRTAINLAIWKAFKEQGIRIPFPQRDLHISNS
ncbi:MAG: mechanosensitive ion channel [Pseudomonadota bacterium]|nr:mechanosensitive ion channel [Pseudomonadota bacterium]